MAALLLISCSTEIPTADEVQTLITAVPDHGIKEGSNVFFTPEYYTLLEQAWAIPSDAIGEIGSDDWLYYFITGNDMPDNVQPPTITNISSTAAGAEVMFSYLDMDHKMDLVLDKGRWLISDYDDTMERLREYIKKQREYFRSDEWKQYLDYIRKEFNAEDADNAEKKVEEYFRRYK